MGTPPQLESNMGPIVHNRPETESSASLHSKTYHSVETCMYRGKKFFPRFRFVCVCPLTVTVGSKRGKCKTFSLSHNDFPAFCYLFFPPQVSRKNFFSFPSRHLSGFLLLGCNRGGLARGRSVKNTLEMAFKSQDRRERAFSLDCSISLETAISRPSYLNVSESSEYS